MGNIIGRTGVAEPAFQVLSTFPAISTSTCSTVAFEIREYSQRFAIETTCSSDNSGFMTLAGYIGVGSAPQNTLDQAVAMTAPVATKQRGVNIAMTAPVATKTVGENISMTAPVSTRNSDKSNKVMSFILPSSYDNIEKIPKPTNPLVRVVSIPPVSGAVTRFAGWVNEKKSEEKKNALLESLRGQGVTPKEPIEWEVWQYNPPFTLPWLRRNEIWIPLTKEETEELLASKEKL